MGLLWKAGLVIIGILSALMHMFYKNYIGPVDLPNFDFNQYWGPEDELSYREDTSIKPFKIIFEENVLNDLNQQLNRKIEFLPPNEGINFEHGFNSAILKDIIKFWRDDYLLRWKERQNFFNKFTHFITQIQGLNIHYIHEKIPENTKKTKKVYPLLILHGWPGSIREFYDLIPLLTEPHNENDFVFEVIAPSLPGFGWSEAASKTGMGPAQMAIVFRNLMLRLGHETFYVQGGDWGSVIGSEMATIFPNNVKGYHSNMCIFTTLGANLKLAIAKMLPNYFFKEGYSDFYPSFGENLPIMLEESGYFHLQATKPNTIGSSLSHNPFGLAAYILEKFSTATDLSHRKLSDGGLTKYFSMDSLIDNLMVYYLTNSITSSVRIYMEALTQNYFALKMQRVTTNVPFGYADFQNDIGHCFDWQLKDKYTNMIHHTYYRNIGHFPALQAPQILSKDIYQFVNKVLEK